MIVQNMYLHMFIITRIGQAVKTIWRKMIKMYAYFLVCDEITGKRNDICESESKYLCEYHQI